MGYIDAEKLIKSVNNYQDGAKAALNPTDGDADYYNGKIDACKDIQEFIASLQQEQQEVDLEKEIEKMWNVFIETEAGRGAFSNIARHFYGLGQLNSK